MTISTISLTERILTGSGSDYRCVAASSDRTKVVACGYEFMTVWNPDTGKMLHHADDLPYEEPKKVVFSIVEDYIVIQYNSHIDIYKLEDYGDYKLHSSIKVSARDFAYCYITSEYKPLLAVTAGTTIQTYKYNQSEHPNKWSEYQVLSVSDDDDSDQADDSGQVNVIADPVFEDEKKPEPYDPESRIKRTLFGVYSQVLQKQSVSGH